MTWRLALVLVAMPWLRAMPARSGLAAAVALWAPLPAALLVAGGLLARRWRRLAERRRQERHADGEVALLGDLVALGLTGGLGLTQALAVASAELDSGLGAEVERMVRRLHRSGAAGLFVDGGGARAGRLYVMAGRAMATGAPLLAAVESFVEDVRGEEARRRRAAARRLPVLLMVPLALLVLPGFFLLLLAPALVSALGRLGS